MKHCPFSSENRRDACNLFSEREDKCTILLIGKNLRNVLNINFNVDEERKSKRPIPTMSSAELEMVYKR